ncbi:MAG TPA: molybdate ABC transporter substrate-binding protein [Anaerolineales bacterium]|nr:molybdate ABC transporter substrate-binding protein [Anaerolineales bacterium]
MKCFLFWFVFLALLLSACSGSKLSSDPRTLTVYAAASLTDAFTEIGKAFEAEQAGVTVAFNFGGSQNLRTQIEQGAPADVFASANTKEMDTLVKGNFVGTGTPKVFLTNQLVVILPKDNPARIASLQDLSKPGLKLVLAAEEVPAGRYARQMLDNLNAQLGSDYKDKVLANVVSNEDNIRQAVTKVQLGEADASIVYVSDAVAEPELQKIEIPANVNVVAEYPIAPLVKSTNSSLANEFIAYVLSSKGQATLKKWGFTPVAP